MASTKHRATTSGTVRFVLDGEVVTVSDVGPTRTVLNFLREDLSRTGTKEGCAEGDCGACTVVVGELAGDDVRFRSINSCIQCVPTLDGKELITVESLKAINGALHPVQRAMVDCHGSQCGFCTPGFVMSLFALYKSAQKPSRRDINDALAGNLCRCTGYRPIVDAAQKMYEYGSDAAKPHEHWMNCSFSSMGDRQRSTSEREMIERLQSIQRRDTLMLSQGTKTYFAPSRAADLAVLREAHPDARILAGGTDVGLWVTKQHKGKHTRELPLDQFYVAYQKTALEPGEFVESIRVPLPVLGGQVRSYKIAKRFDQDISAVCGGYRIVLEDGVVRDVRIAYGGVAATPKRALRCERALLDHPWTQDSVDAAMTELDKDYSPLTDMRASAAYRRLVTRNLFYKFFLETSGKQTQTRVFESA